MRQFLFLFQFLFLGNNLAAQLSTEGSQYLTSTHDAEFELSCDVPTDTSVVARVSFKKGYHLSPNLLGEFGYKNVNDNHLYMSNYSQNGYLNFQVEGLTKMSLDSDGWLQMNTGIWVGPNWFMNGTGQAGGGLTFQGFNATFTDNVTLNGDLLLNTPSTATLEEGTIEIREDYVKGGKVGLQIWDVDANGGYAAIRLGEDGNSSITDIGNFWEIAFNGNALEFYQDGVLHFRFENGGIRKFSSTAMGATRPAKTIFSVDNGDGTSSLHIVH